MKVIAIKVMACIAPSMATTYTFHSFYSISIHASCCNSI